jgi:hypothetical protein
LLLVGGKRRERAREGRPHAYAGSAAEKKYCTGGTFVAQGLAQLRDALNAGQRARTIPIAATGLTLKWSAQPKALRTVLISHASPADFPYGYGFKPSLEVVNAPANGSYYVPVCAG